MALIARYLVHTSAAARMRVPAVGARLEPLITSGLVATCPPLDAEALFSARSPTEYEVIQADRRTAYEYRPLDDDAWGAAFDAQRELIRTGRHRAVGMPDLLTAVLAARHRVVVVHYDTDVEIAAEVLPVDQRWVVPPGTA